MRWLKWWLKYLWLRLEYLERDPWDLDGNQALRDDIDWHIRARLIARSSKKSVR